MSLSILFFSNIVQLVYTHNEWLFDYLRNTIRLNQIYPRHHFLYHLIIYAIFLKNRGVCTFIQGDFIVSFLFYSRSNRYKCYVMFPHVVLIWDTNLHSWFNKIVFGTNILQTMPGNFVWGHPLFLYMGRETTTPFIIKNSLGFCAHYNKCPI